MGLASKIEWTDATWNPWQGCTKVSEACADCYMFSDLRRYGRDPTVVVRSKTVFDLPLQRFKGGAYKIEPGWRVFTCSWSDWFHQAADAWRPEAWEIIRQRPDVTFQIVTKRPERIPECLPADWGDGWPNVWLIVTAENQQRFEERILHLVHVPAAVRGLSCEPLLGPIDLTPRLPASIGRGVCDVCEAVDVPLRDAGCPPSVVGMSACFECMPRSIHWIIVGGESGQHARPMHPDWARGIRDQCQAAGVPFFFKQWGEWRPITFGDAKCESQWLAADGVRRMIGPFESSDALLGRIGKAAAGRLLDGRQWSEFPRTEARV